MSKRIPTADLVDMADRFRAWTRTEEAVGIMDRCCEGSAVAETELVAAFCKAINVPLDHPQWPMLTPKTAPPTGSDVDA